MGRMSTHTAMTWAKGPFARPLRYRGIDGIERVRFMTSIQDLSDKLIEAMKNCSKVCNHSSALQAGSNRILKLMNRRYTKEHYLDLVDRIRAAVPDKLFLPI